MRTIEEKAWDYSDSRRKDADLTDIATAFHDGYIQGATEALQSQWRNVEDELPEDEQEYLCALQFGSCIEYCMMIFSVMSKVWVKDYDDDGFSEHVVAWQPIPKYEPNKEKEL